MSVRRLDLRSRSLPVTQPAIVVTVPVEGPAVARVLAATLEDERRVVFELARRDVAGEVVEAVDRLLDALDERGAA